MESLGPMNELSARLPTKPHFIGVDSTFLPKRIPIRILNAEKNIVRIGMPKIGLAPGFQGPLEWLASSLKAISKVELNQEDCFSD